MIARLSLVLLGALAVVANAVGQTTAPEVEAGPLLLRFACLATASGKPSQPEPSSAASAEVTRALVSWDLDSDRADVSRVFALHHVEEIARQAAELPRGGGQVRGTYAVGERHYRVRLDVSVKAGSDIASIQAEVARDGEVLSAPSIVTRLGDRAVLSSGSPDGATPELFLVVEVGRLPDRD